MGLFNNREVATAFWLIVFAVWALRKREIRGSVCEVFHAFWHLKIVAPVFLIFLYIAGVIALLVAIGMWEVGLLKDTVVWFLVGAMAMMMRFATADDTDDIFQKILTDSIKIVILLEFLVNTRTRSL